MKITLIKQQLKDQNRVSIFVDDVYSFSLTMNQLIEQKIRKNLEVSEQDVARLKKLSDEGKVRARSLDWLLRRPHSAKEFLEYCLRKKIDSDLAQRLLEDFTHKGYIDDQKFAHWFAEQRLLKGKSLRAVLAELAAKGIDSTTARSVIENQRDEDSLRQLVAKLKTRSRYQDEKKLITYLVGKGFFYADIKVVLQDETV